MAEGVRVGSVVGFEVMGVGAGEEGELVAVVAVEAREEVRERCLVEGWLCVER